MAKKLTSEQKLRRALAALDKAVQDWYKEHSPYNKERYASAHIRDFEDGRHVSNITVSLCPGADRFIDIYSSKNHLDDE